ncbi:O6-methylguanine-DNA methyltransferase domain protein, partial [Yersinia pestis PY-11]
MLCHLQKAV